MVLGFGLVLATGCDKSTGTTGTDSEGSSETDFEVCGGLVLGEAYGAGTPGPCGNHDPPKSCQWVVTFYEDGTYAYNNNYVWYEGTYECDGPKITASGGFSGELNPETGYLTWDGVDLFPPSPP